MDAHEAVTSARAAYQANPTPETALAWSKAMDAAERDLLRRYDALIDSIVAQSTGPRAAFKG